METGARFDTAVRGPDSATVLGLGTIGGFTAGLLARCPELRRLTLVDRDIYDTTNLCSQDISVPDVGRPKAAVQADRLRHIAPRLQVEAIVADVQSVPLGLLRAAILVACLDSRRARQIVNQVAWRLGIPWIDAGVNADGCLARVNVYLPAAGQPCLECAFDASDYSAIEQIYPCQGDTPAPPASNAPASLGALAAALQVLECRKLLTRQWEGALIGKQVVVDAASHRHFVTSFRRNHACRFDHATWNIETLEQQPSELSVGAALGLASHTGDASGAALRVEGQLFVTRLTCPSCGTTRALRWRLSGRLGAEQQCAPCRRRMLALGFDASEWLRQSAVPPELLATPLSSLGLRTGEVLSVRAAHGVRHFQLGRVSGAQPGCASPAAAEPLTPPLPARADAARQAGG